MKHKKTVEDASRELAISLTVDRDAVGANDVAEPPQTVEPTASKTDRFIGCPYPWGQLATDNEVGEPARFGSAFHEVMERRLKTGRRLPLAAKAAATTWGIDDDKAVDERVNAALPVLKAWLAGENPWRIDFRKWELSYEVTLAYNIVTGEARKCKPPTLEGHVYEDRLDGEIPGADDLLGVGLVRVAKSTSGIIHDEKAVLVLDYKSGFDVGSPMESGQLLTLALTACRLYGVDRAFIGYLHAPATMTPTIYADDIGARQLEEHACALLEAHERRGSGFFRPGSYCRWCQTASICPKNETALIELRGSKSLATAEDAGRLHEKLSAARKRFAELEKILDTELRMWVKANGDAVRPSDGKEVGFVERSYTNLSQASIVRALGPIKGRKEIERLKKLGAIEEGTRLELRIK